MGANQPSSARVRRDASAHAMQGWHSQRMVANGIIGDQVLKVKNSPFIGIHCIPFFYPSKNAKLSTGQRFDPTFKSW
jgi:hypothetical protein